MNLTNWIPQRLAAERLGVSEKTLTRWAAAGKMRRAMRSYPSRGPEPVYEPGDVEAIAKRLAAIRVKRVENRRTVRDRLDSIEQKLGQLLGSDRA